MGKLQALTVLPMTTTIKLFKDQLASHLKKIFHLAISQASFPPDVKSMCSNNT